MLNDFLLENWFDVLQSVFIVGGFLLSYFSIRRDSRSRKIGHLLQLNQSHRDIWGKTYTQPELLRIRKTEVDIQKHPITEAERRLAIEVILHIYLVYEAIQHKQLDKNEAEKDIADYLKLPIPNAVWQDIKGYHNKQFVNYIDNLDIFADAPEKGK